MMYYTYILQSTVDNKFYTGYTKDLKQRFEQHQKGRVSSTKSRRPLKLIYYEVCLNQQDATHREKYLKSFYGKMYIRKRLKCYLTGFTPLNAWGIYDAYINLQVQLMTSYICDKQKISSDKVLFNRVNEAQAGISKKDFVAKMSIASKEARETRYWLNLLVDSGYISKTNNKIKNLFEEIESIINILTKIVKTGASNEK